MKRLTLAVVVVLALSFAAFGADFGKFTMDVADGWTAQQQDPSVTVTKNDNTAQLVITMASSEGASLKDIAEATAASFAQQGFKNITKPEADEDGDYSFDAVNPSGANTHVLVTGAEGEFCMFTTTIAQGAEAAGNEIQAMLESVNLKD